MTKHTIEVEGLPEGCEIKGIAISSFNATEHPCVINATCFISFEKTKPRRIVLEETGENHQCNAKNTINCDGLLVHIWGEKIWREVKEE